MTTLTYARAEPSGLTKASISNIAETFAEEIGYEPGGDLHEIVRRLGGQIEYEDTIFSDPEKSGSLRARSSNDFTIIVPTHTSPARDRFTIAHELGHFVIHYLWKVQRDNLSSLRMEAKRKDSDRVEWEANWFAAAFLMPSGKFSAAHEACGGNIDELARRFGVSRQAAEVREKSLSL